LKELFYIKIITSLQAAQPSLPFGGIGGSAMGVHHGIKRFREFSNPRGCFVQGGGSTVNMIMPLFSKETDHLIEEVALASMAKQLKFAVKRLPKILFGK
jgi:hypothetical protein